MHSFELPMDYTAVLQQVNDIGEEDFEVLAETLPVDRPRLSHIIQALRNRGLLRIRYTAEETWISLSTRGHRFLELLSGDGYPSYGY